MKLLEARCVAAVTGLKLLLAPAYRSTDFEVHRNWLAVTSQTPLDRWYKEDTSEWTLDYPPAFACFEWLLAQVARVVDPAMLALEAQHLPSSATVLFQRVSVIASDAVLICGVLFATRRWTQRQRLAALVLVLLNPGLLLVDHIHFQYNGMLLGLLVWSLALMAEGRDLAAAVVFTFLVTMKHLFACLGPLYAVYLLRHYCRGKRAVPKFLLLAASVGTVVAASFGPFIAHGQLKQVLLRLFPFGRGLLHAYWAPNFWALYAALDRALAVVLPRLGVVAPLAGSSITGGLVGTSSFSVLPNITPAMTLALVILGMTPCLVHTWRHPSPSKFPFAAAYACLTSFLLGFHVHEKAILMATVPLGWLAASTCLDTQHSSSASTLSKAPQVNLQSASGEAQQTKSRLSKPTRRELQQGPSADEALAMDDKQHGSRVAATDGSKALSRGEDTQREMMKASSPTGDHDSLLMEYFVLATAGHFGLLPLIFTLQEYPIKVLMLFIYTVGVGALLKGPASPQRPSTRHILSLPHVAMLYLWGFVAVEGYCAVIHPAAFHEQLPFLPLMLRSTYSAIGVTSVWLRWTAAYFLSTFKRKTRTE